MHRRDDGGGLGAAADVGLVGGNHENEARSGEGSAGLGDAGEELELSEGVRRVGFAVADDLTIQRAVAVEENGGAGWLGRGRGTEFLTTDERGWTRIQKGDGGGGGNKTRRGERRGEGKRGEGGAGGD